MNAPTQEERSHQYAAPPAAKTANPAARWPHAARTSAECYARLFDVDDHAGAMAALSGMAERERAQQTNVVPFRR